MMDEHKFVYNRHDNFINLVIFLNLIVCFCLTVFVSYHREVCCFYRPKRWVEWEEENDMEANYEAAV
uniref:Uncharacterized protein n=1 Tax=Caenorhabditis japonica TaxID=281687 RepID=A0A8R1EN32_CAEJA